MIENPDIDDLTRSATADLRAAIERAYELGHAAATTEFNTMLVQLREGHDDLRRIMNNVKTRIEHEIMREADTDRAPIGSVKPKILELIRRPQGATTEEMEAVGIKRNSIRGTVYSLQKADLIVRRGDRWYAFETKEAPAASAETSQ